MGCNCKQKREPIKMIRAEDNAINITSNQVITYTQQDIDRARNYLISPNEEEKDWFISFVLEHTNELLVGYCDTVCRKNMTIKLDKLQEKL
jgi:hypothetical protein